MSPAETSLRMTARDLLERVGGATHAFHTVIIKNRIHRGAVLFTCSCGESFEVPASTENTAALRNVGERAS